jgi:ribonuclease HI
MNGTASAKASAAVFVCSYDSLYSSSTTLPDVCTNNVAEIKAYTLAVETAISIFDDTKHTLFSIVGDSTYVTNAITSGAVYAYSLSPLYQHSAIWVGLRDLLVSAREKGLKIEHSWTPRLNNKEADELCNAILDDCPPNLGIRSQPIELPSLESMRALLTSLTKRRLTTLRYLPRSLQAPWAMTVATILDHQLSSEMRRITFLLLPHLLSLRTLHTSGRSSFKLLRTHINMLSDPNYFACSICDLRARLEQAPKPYHPQEESEEREGRRISTLIKQEQYAKALRSNEVYPASPAGFNTSTLDALFPASTLPEPLPQQPFYELVFGEVKLAAKKIKKGKAPGLTGWTRELLFPILDYAPTDTRPHIVNIFSTYINMIDILPEELLLLKTGVLTPLKYKSNPTKVRPIVMTDVIVKICWYAVLIYCVDPSLQHSTHVFGRPGACQLATTAVQAALDAGEIVVSMDAVNAYNTVCRHYTFDYLRNRPTAFSRSFRLLNAFYTTPSHAVWFHNTVPHHSVTITTGTLQGCVSSLWFYTLATLSINIDFSRHIVQAADDIYVIRDALRVVPHLVERHAEGPKQHISGSKTRVLCTPQQASTLRLPTCIQNATIVSTPTKALGAVVQPARLLPGAPNPNNSEVVREMVGKIEKRYERVQGLPVSLQEKWLVLLNITMHCMYHIEASSISLPFISQKIDELQLHTFTSLFSLGPLDPIHHVQLNSPVEDGGFGLFPYSQFAQTCREKMVQRALHFLTNFDLSLQEVFDYPTSELMKLWNAHLRPDVYGSKDWKIQHMAKTFLRLPPYAHQSFLRIPPDSALTTFDNDTFSFIVRHRLRLLIPYQLPPTCQNPPRDPNSHRNFSDHFDVCRNCSSYTFLRRHEAVATAIHRSCRFHGFDSQLVLCHSPEFAKPKRAKGGADVMVFINGRVYAIDVSITRESSATQGYKSSLNTRYKEKVEEYREYAKANPTHTIFPFIMSVYGSYHPTSVELLTEMCKAKKVHVDLRQDILRFTQCALLKSLYSSFCTSKTKHESIAQLLLPPATT